MTSMSDKVDDTGQWLLKGAKYLQSEDYKNAIFCFDKVLENDANSMLALSGKGFALEYLNKHIEAIPYYDKALKLYPKVAKLWSMRGHAAFYLRNYEEALNYHNKALDIDPKSISSLYEKGRALFELKRYEEALQCANDILKLDSKDIDALIAKGGSLFHLGKYQEATDSYNKALDINPDSILALSGKGLALYDLTEYGEAIACFNKILKSEDKLDKNTLIVAYTNKGNSLHNLGQYEDAIKCYDKVLDINQLNDDGYFLRGQAKIALEDYTGALEDLNKVRTGQFRSAEKITSIGQCYFGLGFFEEAEKNYQEAIRSDPKSKRAFYSLAVLYANENKYERAKKQLETCVKIDRNFTQARDALKRLQSSGQLNWDDWWFSDSYKDSKNKAVGKKNKIKRTITFKSILGGIMIALAIVTIAVFIALALMHPTDLAPTVVGGLIFTMAIIFAVLLLPNLKKFKAAGIELEPVIFVPETKLVPSLFILDKSYHELSLT
jgi:tetratricopeptide (TPR) repeat protein